MIGIRCPAGVAVLIHAIAIFSAAPRPAAAQESLVKSFLEGLGREPTLGPEEAPVWIVEFSDFQCGYCRRFWLDTLPNLKQSYIERGKVRFTYRHFAILGKPSERAALAAECAAEQKRFWPYHDRLFEKQGKSVFTESNLRQFARDVGLDGGRFGACLDGAKYRQKVERETATAVHLGGRGTPLFFVNQKLLPGAQPFTLFQKIIEDELAAAKAKK